MQPSGDPRTDPRAAGLNNGPGGNMASSANPYGHLPHGHMPYNIQGSAYAQMMGAHLQNPQMQAQDTNAQHAINPTVMDNLAQAFGGVNLTGYGSFGAARVANNAMNANLVGMPTSVNAPPNNQMCYQLPDGRIFVSGMSSKPAPYQQGPSTYNFTPAQAHYLQQSNYQMNAPMPHTPQAPVWNAAQHLAHEMPDLAAQRRSSYSSNGENGPHTPFFGAVTQGDFRPRVAVADISPQTWNSDSPQSFDQYSVPQQFAKSPNGQYVPKDWDSVCLQHPAIPRPIPAVFSGEKGRGTLDKSLKNERNTTNVYVRGLHPDTTDEMLYDYGVRFGDIISAKSMLDQQTGHCKGFGFIKYHNFDDGENCIRAFFHWGYEAKWARVSHNEKLKTLSEEDNTNLYVSNLPQSFNEHTLMAIFSDYEVQSAKILRDTNGMSRGVGFARFETPEICNEIIELYSGKPVGDEGATLSIRFADTPAQKQLKTVTAERRQFKANEYNTVVYGGQSPYHMSPNMATFPSPLQSRTGYGSYQVPLSPLYTTNYSPMTNAYPIQPMMPITNMRTSMSENTAPSGARYSARIKIESPSALALAKRAATEKINNPSPLKELVNESSKADEEDVKSLTDDKSSPAKSGHSKSSPAKSSPSKSMTGRKTSKL